jgi:hypothetical protein
MATNWDKLLGAQQDEIARNRYDLVKLVEGSSDFKGCKTPMDVFARKLELEGEEGFRASLITFVKTLTFVSKPDRWTAVAFVAIRDRDEKTFANLFNPFGVAGLGL